MTQQAIDPNALIMGSSARSASFKKVGDSVSGTIMSYKTRQRTDLQGNLKTFDNGDPMWQVVITLLTSLQEDDDDDGLRNLYAKGQMLGELRTAVLEAGRKGIEDGGEVSVEYVSDAKPTRKGFSGAKQYLVKYTPPVAADDGAEPF